MDKVVGLFKSPRTPCVSVVIPTYNNAASLRRLLGALHASRRPAGGIEIVVVDDGSTDDTPRVAAEAGVVHIWQPNAGTAAARDCGWRAARGEIVVFFDDDVVPEPDVITLLEQALRHADGVGARFRTLGDDSLIADYQHADGLIDHRVVNGEVRWLITGAAGFRRSALERVGGFDLNFIAAGEDVDLSMRMLIAGCTLAVEPRALVRHDYRARFGQLLETCYRYGMFSSALASRHPMYRGERFALALRRVNPVELVRVYRGFRGEIGRWRSLTFLALHELVVWPYALGLVRSRFVKEPLAAPSWRQVPALQATGSGAVVLDGQRAAVAAVTLSGGPPRPAVEREASAV